MIEKIAVIAIENKKLAIFGSRCGFLGPVLQHYTPFEIESDAIAAAKVKVEQLGYPLEPEICRPFISRMIMTTSRCKR